MHDLQIQTILSEQKKQFDKFKEAQNLTNNIFNPIPTATNGYNIDDLTKYIQQCSTELGIPENNKSEYHYHDTENSTMITRWIARNNLFHAILLYVVLFKLKSTQTVTTQITSFFKTQPQNDTYLKNYKLGNFGSTNPSSDIDACIQYDGTDPQYTVSNCIKCIEDAYVDLVGIPCLKLDIEFYDSYISKTDSDNKETYAVDFTTNSPSEELEQLSKLLPYAIASMMRNIHIGIKPNTYGRSTFSKAYISKPKPGFTPRSDGSISYDVNDILVHLNLNPQIKKNDYGNNNIFSRMEDMNTICIKILQAVFKLLNINCENNKPFRNYFLELLKNRSFFTKAKTLYEPYFKNNTQTPTYNDRRKIYYEKLKLVENKRITNPQPNDNDLLSLMCDSQLYREEGYVLISTVLEVPRVMQKCGNDTNKDGCKEICDESNKYNNPACLMNKSTYLLSMIEQLGFIIRFYIEDKCNAGNNCDKGSHFKTKLDKYLKRWNHAKTKYTQLCILEPKKSKVTTQSPLHLPEPPTQEPPTQEPPTQGQPARGGKRKRKRTKKNKKTKSKKSKKHRKLTRKNKHIHIYNVYHHKLHSSSSKKTKSHCKTFHESRKKIRCI